MTNESAPLSLEACHQCGLPSLTFDDIDEPQECSDPVEHQDLAEPQPDDQASRQEAFLPAASF